MKRRKGGREGEKNRQLMIEKRHLSCKNVEQLIRELAWRWLHRTGIGVARWSPLLELKGRGIAPGRQLP